MNVVITGSLGHISRPLTQELVEKGHQITVISSNSDKQGEIEALGAKAAIGSLRDVEFLTATFQGADAVYTMVPPANYFDQELDLLAHYHTIGNAYAVALEKTGVKRVVNLSTIGGNLDKGNGILAGAHDVEEILNKLPLHVAITHIRPTSFYYNLYGYVEMIKSAGTIFANYGADDVIPWVSPIDIAAAVAEELETSLKDRKARYVVSEELSGHETARILGEAIGKPDLKWVIISDQDTLNGLISIGMQPAVAAGLVEMYAGLHTGFLLAHYNANKPAVIGKVKLTAFANEFAQAFN